MTHNWILDVLADLKAYARKNDLPELAGKLDSASRTAVVELAEREGIAGRTGKDGECAFWAGDAAGYRGVM